MPAVMIQSCIPHACQTPKIFSAKTSRGRASALGLTVKATSLANSKVLMRKQTVRGTSLDVRVPSVKSNARSLSLHCHSGPAKPWATHDARLVLEDGSIFTGKSFGASGTVIKEVVFNTSLSGYQEIMTDPSYAGQFVCFTCPHIGNVGINDDDMESKQCHLGGIIIRSLTLLVSNYRSDMSIEEYCKQQNIMGIADVDTRELTRRIRDKGALVGVISDDASLSDEDLIAKAKSWKIEGVDFLSQVTTKEMYVWKDPTINEWEFNTDQAGTDKYHVVAYDFGIKTNILRRLASYGCKVTVVPAKTPASEVMAMNPDGVFFSNGPGDPSAAPWAVDNAKAILGEVPVFGICMGHQVLGQAFGGTTYKLPFGHHGGNHPVSFLPTGRVEISAQNHNYAVDPSTLPEGVQVTHINLNDGTCAGMSFPSKKAMSIQYHPEAAPGPHDSDPSFADFVAMMEAEKSVKV
mmetsp:Transcript_13010/g.24832  ORF Transcript_13010/g.24832 Transcript_13010/m.24832 type:complete len:463 (+) Transcript_13010:109-1497(+)|eukprot:CAMPEP_0114251014 /NCGR_PEP_ID=MMETSP0058-20121206/15029_1 /TAXON_ID=36894 /ORGANISM="Pyramimonas parkeae, CCMP726" /LENGTH=462 /DNA_ID=CAMNT_0001364757 /DNA_START=109 /DNA_END=1497 /DNA_ORIENTATION=-